MSDAVREARLRTAVAKGIEELERLRGVLLPHYEGKIGEPDIEVINRMRKLSS